MKRGLVVISILSLCAIASMCLCMGCDGDGGADAHDVCYDVIDAFCVQSDALSCDTYADCFRENKDNYDLMFQSPCEMTAVQVEDITRDAETMFPPTESCAELFSADDYLYHVMLDVANACYNRDDTSGGGDTARDLCKHMNDEYCSHAEKLGCGDYDRCYNDSARVCDDVLPASCMVTDADRSMASHYINNVVLSAGSCAALYDIMEDSDATLSDLATSCLGALDSSKRDLCYKMGNAYCARFAGLRCNLYTICYGNRKDDCDAMFDNTCAASAADKDAINAAVDGRIMSVNSCDGLYSIEDDLDDTLTDMAASGCAGGN